MTKTIEAGKLADMIVAGAGPPRFTADDACRAQELDEYLTEWAARQPVPADVAERYDAIAASMIADGYNRFAGWAVVGELAPSRIADRHPQGAFIQYSYAKVRAFRPEQLSDQLSAEWQASGVAFYDMDQLETLRLLHAIYCGETAQVER